MKRSLIILALSALIAGCASTAPLSENDPAYQMLQGIASEHRTNGSQPDKVKVFYWYKKAADQGYAPAQNSLGSMYQAGDGVEQDYARAAFWYQKAVEQKNPQAATNLGFLYDEGLGVPKDQARAMQLYFFAAEVGYIDAMINLGLTYQNGDGVEKDLVRSHMWLDLARYYIGNGVYFKDPQRPSRMLEKIEKNMTKVQIAEAEKLTNEWAISHKKSK